MIRISLGLTQVPALVACVVGLLVRASTSSALPAGAGEEDHDEQRMMADDSCATRRQDMIWTAR